MFRTINAEPPSPYQRVVKEVQCLGNRFTVKTENQCFYQLALVFSKAASLNFNLLYLSKQAELDESATQAARMEMVYWMVSIEDLQDPHHKLPFAPLSIKDPQQYYDSQYANTVRNVGDAEFSTEPINHDLNTQHTCCFLQNLISYMRENGFSDPVVRPDVVLKAFKLIVNDPDSILNSLTREIKEVGPDGKEVTKLVPAVLFAQILVVVALNTSILLHFAVPRNENFFGNEDYPVKMKLVAPPLYALTTQTIDKACTTIGLDFFM
ncbi:hypothetical protein IFM89_000973 [Coptis chinensis]|uniref:Uncharacterized protein n=1 Tax=Coptis chinensis TaxID=261450 RepID=A0A835M3J6_9MAGN|nr:hypothetical protein IFM89_000973 [Coptis chinensis]